MKPNFLSFIYKSIPEFISYYKDKNIKFQNPEELIQRINKSLIKFGTSWSTADFINKSADCGVDISKNIKVNLSNAFKFIIEDLKIKTIRIGCYWDRIEVEEGKYELDQYLINELDILSDYQEIKIIINLGPFKTFRWPESYIPEFYEKLITDRNLEINSLITAKAINYFKNLIKLLKEKYSEKLLNKILYIQFDNEPFNPFGPNPILISTELEAYITQNFTREFNKPVMIDGPMIPDEPSFKKVLYPNLAQMIDYVSICNLDESFMFALNYYYDFPGQFKISGLNLTADHFFVLNTLYPDYAKLIKQKGKFMISEAQFEPWGDRQEPGNDFQSFGFMIYRSCSQFEKAFFKSKLSDYEFLNCLWGIEAFTAKKLFGEFTNNHEKIMKVINYINS